MTLVLERPRAQHWTSVAVSVARTLIDNAIWHDDRCTFYGATPPDTLGAPPQYCSCGGDAYEGSAGIARFLALMAARRNVPGARETALGALRHAMAHEANTSGDISLFCGTTGTALIGREIARAFDDASLAVEANGWLEASAAQALAIEGGIDFLSGTAGAIAGIAAAIAEDPTLTHLTEAVLSSGDALRAIAREHEPGVDAVGGLSWPMYIGAREHLCGLAHGASGFAFAYEALGRIDPDGPWLGYAQQARCFERGYFSLEHGSWADLRRDDDGEEPAGAADADPSYPHMWCHGSIGIAAERLAASAGDSAAGADAIAAMAGVERSARTLLLAPRGPGASDALNGCICHGLSGTIDVLIDAGLKSQNARWFTLASKLAEILTDTAGEAGGNETSLSRWWRSGVPGGYPTPGLMLGKAGTGWTLMRLADPGNTPSGWRFV